MTETARLKQVILLAGDLVLLYVSLAIGLSIRYRSLPTAEVWSQHVWPFTAIFFLWLVVMYIADFYNLRTLKNSFEFNRRWGIVLAINVVSTMVVLYALPSEAGFAPKTNLVLLGCVFGVIGFLWRRVYNIGLRRHSTGNRALMIGESQITQELVAHLKHNPQLGYDVAHWIHHGFDDPEFARLTEIISANRINLIVVPAHMKKNSEAARAIYQNLMLGIEVIDLATLYSLIFQKTPLSEIEEVWFLENIAKHHRLYESLKHLFEFVFAIILSLVLVVPALLIALLIKLTSRGPVFFPHVRIGHNERPFIIYKFRSMVADAEKSGAQWAQKDDPRRTPIGRFLRFTHLDEIPQLINIIRGELSFVGPRPERPEFVEQLKKTIPYYNLRHLVRPGLTGWAQINYRYGASVEDAYEKLQYDIYYLKNCSFWLDVSIVIKTIRTLFINRH